MSVALWKLKLADRASGPVLQFLAKLLSTDAVSNVWRTDNKLLSALVPAPASGTVLCLQTELDSPLLRAPGKPVAREDALVSGGGLVASVVLDSSDP